MRIFIPLIALVTLGCGGETLDGSWSVTSLTCDSVPMPIGDFVLVVDGDQGQFIQGFGAECVATLEETYSYPDDTTFSITPTAISCDPNGGCADVFGGAECLPLAPPTSFTFNRDGDALTFTRTADGPGDAPCQAGEAMVFELQLQ